VILARRVTACASGEQGWPSGVPKAAFLPALHALPLTINKAF